MKKLLTKLSTLCIALMLVVCLSGTAHAEDTASGDCGDQVTWTLSNKGILTISGSGEITSYPWMTDYKSVIKEVIIEDGITSICGSAFQNCSSLRKISIPPSVTKIGSWALHGCSLDELTIHPTLSSVSNVTLDAHVTNLYISDLEHFIRLNAMCSDLEFDNLFINGEQVVHLEIPNSITSIPRNTFDYFKSLESVAIPDSVTSIGSSAFSRCEKLKQVRMSESVAALPSGLFAYCKSLEYITFPASTLVIGADALAYCQNLSSITFMGSAPLITANSFSGVTAEVLYSANNASWTEDMLQQYGGTLTWTADPLIPNSGGFAEAVEVESGQCGDQTAWSLNSKGILTISGSGKITSYPWMTDYKSVIKEVIIEDGITSICGSAFQNCSSLRKISIPPSVTKIGSWALHGCSLDELTIHPTLTDVTDLTLDAHVTNLYISDLEHFIRLNALCSDLEFDNLFINGEQVVHLEIPNSITSIPRNTFDYFKSLESVAIPDSVTSIGSSAFSRCEKLKQVRMSESVAALPSGLFAYCKSLEYITFPASTLVIGADALAYCQNLSSVTFMGSAPLITANSFSGVTAEVLHSANNASWTEDMLQQYGGTLTWTADPLIPNSGGSAEAVEVESGQCGDQTAWSLNSKGALTISGSGEITSYPWMTDYKSVIKEVIIEDGITSICGSAFQNCSSLRKISIPPSVTKIGSWALHGCSLDELTIHPTLSSVSNVTLDAHVTNLYISDLEHFIRLNALCSDLEFDNLFINGEQVVHLEIPNSITSIPRNTFDRFKSLESVAIPDSVTSIGSSAFSRCEKLKQVRMSENVTSIPNSAFVYCKALESITIPASTLVVDASALAYCQNLKTITFMGNAPLIAASSFSGVTATAYYSANNSSWSEDMKLHYGGTITWKSDAAIEGPGDVPEVYIIASGTCGSNVVWTYYSNNTLTIDAGPAPASNDDMAGENRMDNYASAADAPWAQYAGDIKAVVINENVHSIGDNAFASMPNLKKIVVSDDVEEVGTGAFANNEKLAEVTFQGSAPTLGENSFQGTTNVVINHPAGDETWNAEALAGTGSSVTLKPYEPAPEEPQKPETHEHSYTETVTEPTCTAAGYTTFTCQCGDSYTGKEAAALGHDWVSKITTEPTETTEGVRTDTCSRCGETKTESIPKLDHYHRYEFAAVEPTCTKDGYSLYTCACGDSYTQIYRDPLAYRFMSTLDLPVGSGVYKYNVEYMAFFVNRQYFDTIYWDGDAVMNVPAAEYEATVRKYFQVDDETLAQLRTFKPELSQDLLIYNADSDTYTLRMGGGFGGWLDERQYQCYTIKGDTYEVYYAHVTYIFLQDLLEEGVDAWDYWKELGNPDSYEFGGYTFTGGPDGPFAVKSVDTYGKMAVVEVVDDIVRIISVSDFTGHPQKMDDRSGKALGHDWDQGTVTTEPTVDAEGVKTFACSRCGETKTESIPKLDQPEVPEVPEKPEKPENPGVEGVDRLSGKGRCDTAIAAAEALKQQMNVTKFDYMILASGTNFADALAGSYLAAVKSAPILLYQKGNEAKTLDYIINNLSDTGTVYLLGGTGAVSEAIEQDLRANDVNVNRLAGKSRYDTNIAILEEAGVADGQELLVCTAYNYADSLSASATGLPILLVNTKTNPDKALTSGQIDFLAQRKDLKITILGGEGAVSGQLQEIMGKFGQVNRLAGKSRFDTSVMIAQRYFPAAETVVIAYGRNFPDGLCGGPLAYTVGAPLLLTAAGSESAAAAFTEARSINSGYILGGTGALSEDTVGKILGK